MQYNVMFLLLHFEEVWANQICYPIQGSDLGTLSFMTLNAYSVIICEF